MRLLGVAGAVTATCPAAAAAAELCSAALELHAAPATMVAKEARG